MLQVSMSFPKAIQGGKYLDIYLVDYIVYIYIYIYIQYTSIPFARCRHSKDASEVAGVWNPSYWNAPSVGSCRPPHSMLRAVREVLSQEMLVKCGQAGVVYGYDMLSLAIQTFVT